MKLLFAITTPEHTVYKDEVDQVTLPTAQGEITILPNHIPLVAVIVPGEIRVVKNGAEDYLAVAGGFIEVRPGSDVVVLADTAERAEEIDLARAEEAKKRAETLLHEKQFNDVEFANFASKLERELARLRVAGKRRRAHGFSGTPDQI